MRALLGYFIAGSYDDAECVHTSIFIIPDDATDEQIEQFGKELGMKVEEVPVQQVQRVTREVLEAKK